MRGEREKEREREERETWTKRRGKDHGSLLFGENGGGKGKGHEESKLEPPSSPVRLDCIIYAFG